MPCSFSNKKSLSEKYQRAKAAYESAMDEYASDPDLRDHMICWMLDFCGNEESEWAKENRAPTEAEMPLAISGTGTVLAQVVCGWLHEQGANITDSGSGSGGWHLGAHCSDQESRVLCTAARVRFAKEIESGALSLELHFWGWEFRDLHKSECEEPN